MVNKLVIIIDRQVRGKQINNHSEQVSGYFQTEYCHAVSSYISDQFCSFSFGLKNSLIHAKLLG